jgi:mRNA degradation ribonuclease J1/J2
LAKIGTIVAVMGRAQLPNICKNLIAAGRPADTEAALIEWGATERQRVAAGTLLTLPGEAEKKGLSAPSLLVVGKVVSLRDKLSWYEKRPLFGKKILVTRTREQAGKLSRSLRELGAEVLEPRTSIVHASGHAHMDELRLMLALAKPHYLIPVHGELRQLNNHAFLALEQGLPEDRVLVLQNGQLLSLFADKRAEIQETVATGRKLVEGNRLGTPEDPVLKSRRKLSEMGLVIVSLVLDRATLHALAQPKVSVLGVQYAHDADLSAEAEEIAWHSVTNFARDWADYGRSPDPEDHPPEVLIERVKSEVRGLFRHSYNRKPMIQAHVILMDKKDESSG